MKCPNCGETLKKDFLYCEKCGEEIRIVPDFEPEIENSIIETLSAVVLDMAPSDQETDKEAQEENMDMEFAIVSEKKLKRRILIGISLLCLLLLGIFAFFFIRGIYQDKYYRIQVENAQLLYNQKNYEEAIAYYEKALKMEYDVSLLISYADCMAEMGHTDQALSN